MKRTYVNRLPKNEEVKNTNVKIKNGKLIVEVEFKDKFEPKDGDFLISSKGFIFIYNGKSVYNSYGCYCGVNTLNNIQFNNLGCTWSWTWKTGCRYATKLEKFAFLERLKKECGKKWNAEKKCLEDIYVPKFGDIVCIEYPDEKSYSRQYVISIFPNKEIPNKSKSGFFDITYIDMEGRFHINSDAYYNHGYVREATIDEKQELFDKLAEVGKRWNPVTKKLEDIRWKPKKG